MSTSPAHHSMFGIEVRYDCNVYMIVSSPRVERVGAIILAEWPHGGAVTSRRALSIFRRDEKRRQMVRGRLDWTKQHKPPKQIIGFQHDPTANHGDGCRCGCHWAEGLTGTLREDSDTPKLIELGGAVYDFESEYHRELSVYYRLEELDDAEVPVAATA
jgi:hypothetical protein